MFKIPLRAFLVIALVTIVGIGLLADSGANHQVRDIHFGVSGGNVNNHSNAFCCSGTLGSLVAASGVKYILSNNHILADTDQATVGDDISQPGLVDTSCQPATIVADFTAAPKLGSANVDAAIAALRSGQMVVSSRTSAYLITRSLPLLSTWTWPRVVAQPESPAATCNPSTPR